MTATAAQIANRTTMQGRFIAHLREATQLNMQAAVLGASHQHASNRLKAVNLVLEREFGVPTR